MMSRRSMARRRPELWLYGVFAIVATAFYTKDGLGAIFALGVTPGIRTWLRLYVVIGLFGLLTVGRLVTVLEGRRRLAAAAAVVGLLVVGVLDQTSPGVAPNYEANRTHLAQVAAMTRQLEAELAPRCAVFQLPVVRFPDSVNPGTLGNYELYLPYLASSSDLRWSFGAIQGTAAAEWQSRLPADVPQLIEDLAAADFCAVTVDTRGYDQPSVILDRLTSALGASLAHSTDGRLVTFDLRPLRAQLVASDGEVSVAARGHRILHPFEPASAAGSAT
jgi:hypothetical protein